MSWQKNVYIITGQPGGGKSSVSKILKEKGAYIIDADKISKELLCPKSDVYQKTLDHFGEKILSKINTQEIDRKKLAEIVFSNIDEKKALEAILHPEVRKEVQRLAKSASINTLVFYDCPLFFETRQSSKNFKGIIVVKTDEDIAKKRFLARVKNKNISNKNISDEFYDKLYKSQWQISEKVKFADFIIENNQGIEELKKSVDDLWIKLVSLSKQNNKWQKSQ